MDRKRSVMPEMLGLLQATLNRDDQPTQPPMKKNGITTVECRRLKEDAAGQKRWKLWGPYLSERQWGTVREDYSPHGNAWEYVPHDHERSRAYRWGEDGLAGISDDQQRLCLSLALWNGKDPILKERLFGLTNAEGNHGEDAKELYYYLDATPTHSYLKILYKYPQREFPYAQLVEENSRRKGDSGQPEFELLDTGMFDDDRYFDVFVEYAKAGPEEILMRVTVHNRGPEAATIHLLPQLWFRNTWSWKPDAKQPQLSLGKSSTISAKHAELGDYTLSCDGKPEILFCDNETNSRRLHPFADFDAIFATRLREADEFYAELQADNADADARNVQRQAFAGMIWSKQFFYYDIGEWIKGDSGQFPPPNERKHVRIAEWQHLNNADIISMPDKWE